MTFQVLRLRTHQIEIKLPYHALNGQITIINVMFQLQTGRHICKTVPHSAQKRECSLGRALAVRETQADMLSRSPLFLRRFV